MKKLDYLLVIIAFMVALGLFVVYQIATSPEILNSLVKAGMLNNSKETIKNVILTFYSLIFILFIVIALFLSRVLLRLIRTNKE
ncbi:MAG: hypothetical protein LBQ34_04120 [Alphaproteobacteria bacterium]|jgi:hypothetical protein|nr:hypothetical protein [Alphaproteobacteria bacterium]